MTELDLFPEVLWTVRILFDGFVILAGLLVVFRGLLFLWFWLWE